MDALNLEIGSKATPTRVIHHLILYGSLLLFTLNWAYVWVVWNKIQFKRQILQTESLDAVTSLSRWLSSERSVSCCHFAKCLTVVASYTRLKQNAAHLTTCCSVFEAAERLQWFPAIVINNNKLITAIIRPPDIVCRQTYTLPVFLSFFFLSFFRQLISEVAERN